VAQIGNVYVVKWFFSTAALMLAALLLILALAGFTWGERSVEEDRRGLDIAVAIDVSRSMLASDVPPNRLVRARELLRGLIEELPASRFSVVVFKGTAVRVVPLTEDTIALESFLDVLGVDLLSAPGTDVEAGIQSALDGFPEGTSRHRVIVLFSDGESLTGAAAEAARRAGREGIPIFSVATGTEDGAPVMLANGRLLTDTSDRVVVSRMEPDVLQDIAALSGGEFIRADDPDAFARLTRGIRSHEQRRQAEGFRLVPVRRYGFFLTAALCLLAVYLGIRIVRWRNIF
jgi:Ca-activated chloride channel family protein